MPNLFNSDILECPECGSKEFYEKSVKSYEKSSKMVYNSIHVRTDAECVNCGHKIKDINKEKQNV